MTPLGNGDEPAIGIGGHALGRLLLERGRECLCQKVFRASHVARPHDEKRDQAPIAFPRYPLDRLARLSSVHGNAIDVRP